MAQLSEDWTYGDPCQCGCGGQPKGKRSRFLPGHDARMHSKTPAALKPVIATTRTPKNRVTVAQAGAIIDSLQPKTKWQHRSPQYETGHTPTPKATNRRVCAGCGKPIKRVDANDGPEALKALFRF